MGAWNIDSGSSDAGPGLRDLLPRWDELSGEALRSIERDPIAGPELRMLQRVDRWLEQRCAPRTPCPSAEELYDYGRGPGARQLAAERQAEIMEHLEACSECEALSGTLDLSPPVPLEWSAEEESVERDRPHASDSGAALTAHRLGEEHPAARLIGEAASTDATPAKTSAGTERTSAAASIEQRSREAMLHVHPRWQRNARRLAPAAAAAGLLALGLITTHDSSADAGAGGLIEAPLLRGEASGPLLFPRGPVLAGGAFGAAPSFELQEQAGATEYRVVLHRHDGGAFSSGREVLRAESPDALIRAGLSLAPGHYTWEGWAVVDGLDRKLGSRDFQVLEDSALRAQAERCAPTERVRLLHQAGFLTDARHLAWTLPESTFRSEYLRLVPGR